MRFRPATALLPVGIALTLASGGCKKEEAQPVPLPEAEKVSQAAAPLEAEEAAAPEVADRQLVASKTGRARGPKTAAPAREAHAGHRAPPGATHRAVPPAPAELPAEAAAEAPSGAAVAPPAETGEAAALHVAGLPPTAGAAADAALPQGAVVVDVPAAALGLQAPEAAAEPPTAVVGTGGGAPRGRFTAADLQAVNRPGGAGPGGAMAPRAPRGPVGGPPGAEPSFDEGLDTPPVARPVGRPMRPGGPVRPGAAVDPTTGRPPMGGRADVVPPGTPSPADAAVPGMDPGMDPGAHNPGRAPVVLPTQARPNAAIYLRDTDVIEALGAKRPLDVHELPGLAGDDRYDSLYFGSPDGTQYYAGLQIWRPRSPIDAQRRYTQMVRSYPNAEETTAVGSKTFFAYWNDLYYLVFLLSDNASPTVVALTCDQRTCDTPQELVTLASKIYDRLNAKDVAP